MIDTRQITVKELGRPRGRGMVVVVRVRMSLGAPELSLQSAASLLVEQGRWR
ncbi:hypothetical protein J6590_013704 [Homalodisca vitripennis]|nr:hypothetical protein J6590_013704 [Homalodisca vitripennis]